MRIRSILRGSGYVVFAAGILALSYVCYAIVDARLYQSSQSRRFQKAITESGPPINNGKDTPASHVLAALPAPNDGKPVKPQMVETDRSVLGRVDIGAVGIRVMILEGIDEATLRRAVGHIPGTSLPGQKGNVAIAGHRDTFFRGLRKVHQGDAITLTTLKGSYRYRVDSTEVVDPEDTEVLDESDDAILTLITCYPFNFVGSAPRRFIVRSHRISG